MRGRLSSVSMRIRWFLPVLARRKAPWLAFVVGFVTASACWGLLSPSPRHRLPLPVAGANVGCDVVASPDLRYAAVSFGTFPDPMEWVGETKLWDLASGRHLFSIPFKKVNSPWEAIISSADQIVADFAEGKPRFHKIPSGELWKPAFDVY